MKRTQIQLKNGQNLEGFIIGFRPDLGDEYLVFWGHQEKPEKIYLSDIESCITYGVQVQADCYQDIDELERARKHGWNPKTRLSTSGTQCVKIQVGNDVKLYSRNYKYTFNVINGESNRWGAEKEDDPQWCVYGPEIADIEISTICHGINNKSCEFCYKSNTAKGTNMSLETFEKVLDKINTAVLTQIAFGIGDIDANPDLWGIFKHCRENKIIPNVTINGDRMTSEYYDNLAELCGAVAVSRYNPSDICYNAVKELTDRNMQQVNIHMVLSQESYEDCLKLIDDACTDPRLENLNAIVFLALKEKGRGKSMHSLRDTEKYKYLVEKAFKQNVAIGFDSCSAPIFLKSMENNSNYKLFSQLSEPCESTLFSIYVDVKGNIWPCSFLENEEYEPINLLEIDDFIKECWHSEKLDKFREDLINTTKSANCLVAGCRECPKYNLYR